MRAPAGLLPEPNKIILVVSLWNVPRLEDFFRGYDLQVVTGSRYLGGFVGKKVVQDMWLEEKL